MKTTITVSVRDGWMAVATKNGDVTTLNDAVRIAAITRIAECYWGTGEYVGHDDGRRFCTLYGSGFCVEVDDVRAAEIMELIHAGRGELVREVDG